MPKYQVDILLAAWQDIDRISDFHLKMVGAASAEKSQIISWIRWQNSLRFPIWVHSIPTPNWPDWSIARSFVEIMSAYTK